MIQLPPWLLPLLVGWLLGLVAAQLQEWLRRKRERREFAATIIAELEGLFQRYDDVVGKELERAQKPEQFPSGLQPGLNYFAVFDANASKLGMLRGEDAQQLVAFYVQAKGHMDDLRIWLEHIRPNGDQERIASYFGRLKKDHNELTQAKPSLITLLGKYTH